MKKESLLGEGVMRGGEAGKGRKEPVGLMLRGIKGRKGEADYGATKTVTMNREKKKLKLFTTRLSTICWVPIIGKKGGKRWRESEITRIAGSAED